MKKFFLFLVEFLATTITWPFSSIICGVIIAAKVLKKTNEGFFPQLVMTWSGEKDDEFPPLFFSLLLILSGVFGLCLLWQGHYIWYLLITTVIYITAGYSLEELFIFSRRFTAGVKKTGQGASHLLHLFCRNLAEGDGIWWLLGLFLWPIKTAWLVWPRGNRPLAIFYTVVFLFVFGGYLVGYLPYQIIYLFLMIVWGFLFIYVDK